MTTADDILRFWFADGPDVYRTCWFRRSDAYDAEIRDRFAAAQQQAHDGALDAWAATPDGTLALAILLDQFPRNLFRGEARAFASDPAARALAAEAVGRGDDFSLSPVQRIFLYLPFEHGEAMQHQDRSVALFEGLRDVPSMAAPGAAIDYAWRHRAVIRTFGRFPHRNAALGRDSTAAEKAWLGAGGGF